MSKTSKIVLSLIVIALVIGLAISRLMSFDQFLENISEEVQKKAGYKIIIGGKPRIETSNRVKIIIPNTFL